jgi:hypothetical protein
MSLKLQLASDVVERQVAVVATADDDERHLQFDSLYTFCL